MKNMIRRFLILALCALMLSVNVLADDPETLTSGDLSYVLEDGKVTITACSPSVEGKVTIPGSIEGRKVTALGERAFADCAGLTEVSIPKSVKSIGKECFAGTSLASVTIPAGVETIGARAFSAASLKSIAVNKSNKKFSAAKGVLFNKKQTTLVCFPAAKTGSYTLPKTVKKISAGAFSRSALTELKFPSNGKLETVGAGAFAESSLTALSLPKTVKTLGKGAFEACTSLRKVTLPADLTELSEGTFRGCAALEKVSVSKSLKTVGAEAFAGCEALTALELPSGVKTLGDHAFDGCRALSRVKLPSGVTALPEGAFRECAALTGLNLSPKLTSVGAEAFASSGLQSITIPAGVTSLGDRAFADCAGLKEVIFNHDSADALTFGQDVFSREGSAALTVRVPEPDKPAAAIHGYDWTGDGLAVTYAQNENITVRTVKMAGTRNLFSGVEVNWAEIPEAKSYHVYRRLSGDEKWSEIGTTTSLSYIDKKAKSGKTYSYSVRAERDGFLSRVDPEGVTATYVAAPNLTGIYNSYAGVTIRWEKPAGASRFRVFRKTNGGDWVKMADTKSSSYTDGSVVLGRTYTYTVRCISADGGENLSSYDPKGLSIVYYPLPIPTIRTLNAASDGIKIEWNAVDGAGRYRLFRKTGNGDWVALVDTTAVSYYDTNTPLGTKFTYTVRCVSADGKTFLSNYNQGESLTRVKAPVLTSLTNVRSGIEVKWNAVSGAENYRVYRKTGGGSWTKVGDSQGTSLIDTGVKSGTEYTYTVRCITRDGRFCASIYDQTGKSGTFIATPSLKSCTVGNQGIYFTWNGVKGASRYRVFRKTGGGEWKYVADVSSTTYVDHNVYSGNRYTYTVRCLNSSGTALLSDYDHAGRGVLFLAAPNLGSVSKVSGGVQVTWGNVSGAAQYRIYRKTNGGSWQAVGNTTGTSFVDRNVKTGNNYTYTVRCIASDGSTYASGYSETGKSISY